MSTSKKRQGDKSTSLVIEPDPLKIFYVVVHDDEDFEDASPFQGFGASWRETRFALPAMATLPASVAEPAFPLDGLIAQRMAGLHRLSWTPLMIGALEALRAENFGFYLVLFSGSEEVAKRVETWIQAQTRAVLHFRIPEMSKNLEAVSPTVREFCRKVLDSHSHELSAPRRGAAERGLAAWGARQPVPIDLEERGHNATSANEYVLRRAERELRPGQRFIGNSEADYDHVVVNSAEAVMALRAQIGHRDFHRLYPPVPAVVLTEPALYRFAYRVSGPPMEFETPAMRAALRRLQKQTGLWSTMSAEDVRLFLEDPKAQILVSMRQDELATHTSGIALMAAQTCSAVLRLRPGVNHVFQALTRFAQNIRARANSARFKTPRLFDAVQRELREAVGNARLDFLKRHPGAVKIVSDAPLELLPLGSLPLAMRFDTSRINATPGNLMMGELAVRSRVTLPLPVLSKIIVISAFDEDDPLRNVLRNALDRIGPQLDGQVQIEFTRADTVEDLVDILNASDAMILVFDGHGRAGHQDGMSAIMIGEVPLNIWDLRGTVRVPPIVILSACDTNAIDAPTHVTVGNAFIAAGAKAVMATLLPVGGVPAAVLVARLLFRLAAFVPAAIKTRGRVITWMEIAGGLLRMVLATELSHTLLANTSLDEHARADIDAHVSAAINAGDPAWFEAFIAKASSALGVGEKDLLEKARIVICRSEAIRYVQLGWPEDIVVDDGSIVASFFPPGIEEVLGVEPWTPLSPRTAGNEP